MNERWCTQQNIPIFFCASLAVIFYNISECKLKSLAKQELPDGAAFFIMNWRKQLCTCEECKVINKKYLHDRVKHMIDITYLE